MRVATNKEVDFGGLYNESYAAVSFVLLKKMQNDAVCDASEAEY